MGRYIINGSGAFITDDLLKANPMTARIARALISVSDKTGLVEFAKSLHEQGVEILSTGGSAKAIEAAGIPVKEVADHTGFRRQRTTNRLRLLSIRLITTALLPK